jgi:hypothetical protein
MALLPSLSLVIIPYVIIIPSEQITGLPSRKGAPPKAITNLVVCFLLGDSLASEIYMLMFGNTLSVPSS